MASELKPLIQRDFSGGENTVTNPYGLKDTQVQQALNFILDEHGSLRVRDGTLKQGVQSPRPDRPMVKLYDLILTNGSVKRVAILLGTFGNNSLYQRDTNPWTFIGDFASVYRLPDAVTFTNLMVIAAGNTETLKNYDGSTTFGVLVGAPNAAHVASHLNALHVWNTNNTTTATTGPSSLQSSDLNNPNSWPAGNQTFIARDDGTSGQGLAQFTIAETGISPTSTIIAWKDFTGYDCTGVLGASGFAVQKIKSDMGCVAPRSIQFISGFGIIRLSHRGFALYDGVNDTLISEEERPRIFGRDAYVGLDWTNISRSMATQIPNPPVYICGCPVSGSNGTLQRIFCYDLVRRSWTICTYPNDLSTVQQILDPGVLPSALSGDASGGYVRRIFGGDATDDGSVVNWALLSRAFMGAGPTERAYFRRLLLAVFGMTAGTPITANFYYGPTNVLTQKTVTVNVPTITQISTYAGWGTDPWGTTPWGSQNAATITDSIMNFDVGATVDNVQVGISGSGPGKIRAMDMQLRSKPPTRAVAANA